MTYHRFTSDSGDPYGSFETFHKSADDVRRDWCIREPESEETEEGEWLPPMYGVPSESPGGPDDGTEHAEHLAGWYWVAGFPGCLWDGDPMGPFETEELAIADANGGD